MIYKKNYNNLSIVTFYEYYFDKYAFHTCTNRVSFWFNIVLLETSSYILWVKIRSVMYVGNVCEINYAHSSLSVSNREGYISRLKHGHSYDQ